MSSQVALERAAKPHGATCSMLDHSTSSARASPAGSSMARMRSRARAARSMPALVWTSLISVARSCPRGRAASTSRVKCRASITQPRGTGKRSRSSRPSAAALPPTRFGPVLRPIPAASSGRSHSVTSGAASSDPPNVSWRASDTCGDAYHDCERAGQ